MATLTHTRGDTLPLTLALPEGALAATLQVRTVAACVEAHGTISNGIASFDPTALNDLTPGRVYRATARVTLASGATQTIGGYAVMTLEGCGDAPPAPSGIILSGALVEAGADVASGSASVGISLSGAMVEVGSDTASGNLSIGAPGAITLSAAMVESGADTASGEMTVTTPVPADTFPAIDGQFYHFRQEDVTASGVSTANGAPLSMALAGTLARAEFDGTEYLDGSKGALHTTLGTPFPADAPITIWMMTSGHRNSGVFVYLGPPNFAPGSNNLNFRATGSLIVQRTSATADIATWSVPAAARPETVAYHRPAGTGVSSQAFKSRIKGVDVGAPTGAFTTTAPTGTSLVIGGRRDTSGAVVIGNTAGTGTFWRDVVIYVGTPAKPDLSAAEIAALEAYAAARVAPPPPVSANPPTVSVAAGGYPGTTPTVSPTGEVTITNAATHLSGDLGVTHYLVKADNMLGRKLVARRSTAAPNNNANGAVLGQWQMAWTHDPHSEDWRRFDVIEMDGATVVARELDYLEQDTVYVARRPVFTPQRWEAAIARWIAHPLTTPTASGGSNYIVGTLPENQYAPEMPLYGFKVGTGSIPFLVTTGIHSDEHIVGWSSEAFIDWLLSDHADAVWLRDRLTIYVYPRVNPQGHHAGANRVEVTTGQNANRIFLGGDFDHIPLSKTLRDAWAADLPTTLGGHYDWHDSIQGVRRGFVYHRNSLAYAQLLDGIYKARTGSNIVIEPSTTTAGVSAYIYETFAPAVSITVEHELSVSDGIPEWKAWGLDLAAALRASVDSLLVAPPTGITLSAALTEGGADTASGEMTVGPAPIAAQRVIVLTDYAGDCDDAAALLIASDAHKKQEIDILGVVVTSTIATSAPGVYGQLAAYGMQDVPVYAYQGSLGTYNNNISAPVRDAFGVPDQTRAAFEDDVTGLRRMLAAAPDASVKVIDIGAPVSLARLLDSPADAISPMTGMQLVAAKVTGLWAMAGNFPTGTAEYNMTRHIPSSQRVFHDWPTPIYAHGGEVGGDVFTAPPAGSQAAYDPVKVAFDAHPALTNGKRQSWDPVAVHHAIYGNGTLYTLAGQGGTITIDSAGVSTWSATPAGNRSYVAKAASASQVASALQAIIDTADLLVVKPPPPALSRVFPVTEGSGTLLTADSGDKASVLGASWATDPARLAFNGTSSRVEMQFFPAEFSDDDFLLGAVVRFATTSGTRVIAARSANPNLLRYFQFRQTGGALEYVSFNYLGDATPAGATIISSAAGAVAANTWTLATVHVANTSAILRLNGVQVATGTFVQRTNTLDDTTPIMWGARRRDASTITDYLSGDIAAMGVRFGAAPADASDFEAQLRAIATSKGITLP